MRFEPNGMTAVRRGQRVVASAAPIGSPAAGRLVERIAACGCGPTA
jgi:hypothetical protein